MGSRLGAMRIAASRHGLTVAEHKGFVDAGQKRCTRCCCWLSLDRFDVDNSRCDGRAYICRGCRRVGPKQKRLIIETRAEQHRRRYRNDPKFRHDVIQRVRARRRNTQPLSFDDAEYQLGLTDGLCLYCDRPAASWDHIVPVSKGGSSRRSNMAPCCRSCNSKKKASDLFEFIDKYSVEITDRLMRLTEEAVSIGDQVI